MKQQLPTGPHSTVRRAAGARPFVLYALLWALLAGMAGPASLSASARDDEVPRGTFYVYLPLVLRFGAPAPMANPSFEDESWFTDGTGNQHPAGWSFYSPAAGELMPFPTKRQGGKTVPAISGGPGEYVHRYFWQLPEDEWLGAPRALILHGQLTYKAFGGLPQALRLSQTLSGTPGHWLRITAYILGETHDPAPLEEDHFVASVKLGEVSDTRFYVEMKDRRAVPGNERAWNKFIVTAQVPDSGQLALEVVMQQNWAGQTDFFIDNLSAETAPSP